MGVGDCGLAGASAIIVLTRQEIIIYSPNSGVLTEAWSSDGKWRGLCGPADEAKKNRRDRDRDAVAFKNWRQLFWRDEI